MCKALRHHISEYHCILRRGFSTLWCDLPILDSIDLCFLQEHWLIPDQLHKIDAISDDLLSVSVSGMDSFSLLTALSSSWWVCYFI